MAVGVATAMVVLAAAGGAIYLNLSVPEEDTGLKMDPKAAIGSVTVDREELVAQLQQQVDDSMLTMSINATPVMVLSEPEEGVNWQIENLEGQRKLIQVLVYRDDTGELIYETGALQPGTYVTNTPPDVSLPAGTYSCTAYFRSYRLEDQKYLGQAGAQITLTVLE